MPKFRILPKVQSFADAKGNQYKPGDIVELPARYASFNWLEPLKKPKKPKAPPAKVEPASEVKPVPLGKPKKSKS